MTDHPRSRFAIYPAGPMSNANPLLFLRNLDEGQIWTARLFEEGFSPFPVFTDFAYLMRVMPVPPIESVWNRSIQWLRRADAVFCIPGWQQSRGVAQERMVAESLSIPIFYEMDDLIGWADELIAAAVVDPLMAAQRILERSDD